MAVYKCKMCGGDLSITDMDKVVACDYCGTTQTVPMADSEKKLTLFNRANRLRLAGEFDKAAGIYENIVAEFSEEAEAYWGLCLCNYGIEYVDDPATGKKIPTCHRASFQKLREDENFELAMEYADVIAQKVYRDEAREIDRINEEILSISRNESPYDVFICYKETDESGERTPDSVMAQDIYDALTTKGLKVFFARISLESKLGQQYEPYIFAALNSAKIMLCVGTRYEYFHAVWVKNEWGRFLRLAAKDKTKMLIPCYKDMDPYDLPDAFKGLQAQDLGKLGAIQDLVRGVGKLIGNHTVSTTEPAPRSTGALTKRGYIFLEDQDYKTADDCFERALDENPEDSKAYLGKVLSALNLSTKEELNNVLFDPDSFKDFGRAIRFSDGVEKNALLSVYETAKKKYYAKCFSSVISGWARKLESVERKREEEKRRREEAARLQAEKAQKEADTQKKAEIVIAAIQRKQQEATDGSLEQQLATEQQKASFFETICKNYDGVTAKLSQKYNTQKGLQKQIYDLQMKRNALGVFSGKEKKQLDGEIFDKSQQMQSLSSEIAALTNNLYGFQNKQQAEQALNGAKKKVERIEKEIADARKAGQSDFTFSEAVRCFYGDPHVRQMVKKKAPRLLYKGFITVQFGRYPQKSEKENAPIEWLVLEIKNDRALLLSRCALDCKPYNNTFTKTTWEKCTLRAWLNGPFYNAAFGMDHQKMIVSSTNTNGSLVTDNTIDKVFLLSESEAKIYLGFEIGFDRKKICAPTDYAVTQGAYENNNVCWWWLRSPGFSNSARAAIVKPDGSVNDSGVDVSSGSGAVRPALWIDLST